MDYQKRSSVQGEWVKASEIQSGSIAKLTAETVPQAGEFGTQDVSKIIFKGDKESKNVRLNKTTINGLIDAFGNDSKDWMGKYLTVQTEKALVAGKRVTILYLIPEGFTLKERDGYLEISKVSEEERIENVKQDEDGNFEDIPF